MRQISRFLLCLFSMGMLSTAVVAENNSGRLIVDDRAAVFSSKGIREAQETFASASFSEATSFSVVTFKTIPEDRRELFQRIKASESEKRRFFAEWAVEVAKEKQADVLVFISMEGTHIRAINDRRTDIQRNFGSEQLRELEAKFVRGFSAGNKESNPEQKVLLHDAALQDGVRFVIDTLQTSAASSKARTNSSNQANSGEDGGGMMGWICVGLAAFLGLWLMIGLIRSFSGGGRGMGNGGGPGGMGGGMGGGGFMTGLLGGMFGAMAGHYIYDSFFGGNSSAAASDSFTDSQNMNDGMKDFDSGGDGGGSDFTRDMDYGGSDFGGDDFGGGDFGGGGDW